MTQKVANNYKLKAKRRSTGPTACATPINLNLNLNLTTAAAKRADFCATLQYIVTAAHHATPDDDLKKCGLFQNYLSPRFSEMSTDSVAAELRRDGVRGGGAFVAPPRRLV